MLGDFEQKLGMTTSGVQLCSFGGCSPSQVTSTSPQEPVGSAVCIPPFWNVQHSSFCHCGKFLNTGASFFALAPEIVVAPVLGVHPTALKVCGRGEGGMVPLQPHRMGAALGCLPGCTQRYQCHSSNSPSLSKTHKALLVKSCLLPLDLCRRSV